MLISSEVKSSAKLEVSTITSVSFFSITKSSSVILSGRSVSLEIV
jgi:hypothetical protein|nr:MAG TPA: hypothetical protein [Caudoviricetes sp.]